MCHVGATVYIMTNPDLPSWTAVDKLSKVDQGQMVMTKSTKHHMLCHPEMFTPGGRDGGPAVYPLTTVLQEEINVIVLWAHETLGYSAYLLFGIRVDDRNPRYRLLSITKCCAFWSFVPVSALALVLQ